MSFEIASVTSCGQSLIARATVTNKIVFTKTYIETTARTAANIGSAQALPILTSQVEGLIQSVTYSLNQTRVTTRFNNLQTTSNFHTVWLMARLADEQDNQAVPVCAIVSSEPVYIPTTSQSDTHIDIHLNLSFVRADGTVSITEGPALTISDFEQYRSEIRAEMDDVEADVDDLQDTYVDKASAQTITGNKTFSGTTAFNGAVNANSTLKVTGSTTLGTTSTGTLTSGTTTSYAHSPRTNSTSSSTGYDLGSTSKRWKTVYARDGQFASNVSCESINVTASSSFGENVTVAESLTVEGETNLGHVTAEEISSSGILPNAHSTGGTTGHDLGSSSLSWRTLYCRNAELNGSIYALGSITAECDLYSVGNATIEGNTEILGDLCCHYVVSEDIRSNNHNPSVSSTTASTGYSLGNADKRWKYLYARDGNFSNNVSVSGSVTATTFSGNLTGSLTNARYIDGVSFNGSASITHYCVCNTAAATANKAVTLTGFTATTGARILIKFTYTNTAANPKLVINNGSAYAIRSYGTTTPGATVAASWREGQVLEFVFDGSYFYIIDRSNLVLRATTLSEADGATDLLTRDTTYGLCSSVRLTPSSNKGASLGHSDRYWNYGYVDTLYISTLASIAGSLSVSGTSTLRNVLPNSSNTYNLGSSAFKWNNGYITNITSSSITNSGNLTVNGESTLKDTRVTKLYFSNDVSMNVYGGGVDVKGHLTPVTGNAYNLGALDYKWNNGYITTLYANVVRPPAASSSYTLGTSSYYWERLYVNYISGVGVAKANAGYGTGTTQTFGAIGSLTLAQLITPTLANGTQALSETEYQPTAFGNVQGSRLKPSALYASPIGATAHAQCEEFTLSGTWRILNCVYDSNITSYPPVVLVVRIA